MKNLTPDHEFVLLACDGIWDVLSNEEVVEFVRIRIADQMEPEQVCARLMFAATTVPRLRLRPTLRRPIPPVH